MSVFDPSRLGHAIAALGIGLTTVMLAAPSARASSHREAPFISGQAQVDATDLYMFRSYETGRQDFVIAGLKEADVAAYLQALK